MISRIARFVAVFGLLAISACGAGGSAPTGVPERPAAQPQNHGTGTVTITIAIPARAASAARSARYVSPSAQSIRIDAYPVTAGVIAGSPSTTANQDLSATSPGCSGGTPNVCAVTMSLGAGVFAFGIKLYQYTSESGAILSQLDPTAATERTIVAGTNNVVVPLVLGGVPSTIVVTAPTTTFVAGSSASVALSVVAKDAAGNTIVGSEPYETPIALTTTDGTAVSFTPTSLTSPTTAATLAYNGTAPATTSVSVGATSGTANATPISFPFTPAAPVVGCATGCSSLFNGTTAPTLTLSETGYSGTFATSVAGASCNRAPATSTLSLGSGSVTVYPNPQGGTCTLTATDRFGSSAFGTPNYAAANDPTPANICGPSLPIPADPNGGFLYIYNGCANNGFRYGAYTYLALMSNYNPSSFQVAIYSDPNAAAVRQFTVSGNRYITSISVATGGITFNGQSGATFVANATLVP